MNHQRRTDAFTLVELLVVIAALVLLTCILLPALATGKEQARRIHCTSNLKQVTTGLRLFAMDSEGKHPWHTSRDFGGTFGSSSRRAWRNFASLSNELENPHLLACPSDKTTLPARSWTEFVSFERRDEALGYFVGLDSFEEVPASFVAGDRNISGGLRDLCRSVSPEGVRSLQFRPGNPAIGWSGEIHRFEGNIALYDGSVVRTKKAGLRAMTATTYRALAKSGVRTMDGIPQANHVLPPSKD